MRKFLLTLVVLVAGAMSAWADDVAKIDETCYETLADAVEAAQSGDIITMQQDVALDATLVIPAGKTIVLDLNGKTISQEKVCTASYEMILNKGNLTITGDGKLSFKDTSAGDPSFGWGSYTLRNEGTLVVENGTIAHVGEQAFATHMICAIFQYSGSTTINGGTISTPKYRSVRLWKGDMTINGGTFEGQVWVQSVDDSSVLTVNGGTFAPRGGDGSSVFVGNVTSSGVHHTAGLSVTGGTFTTKIGCNDAAKLTGDLITGGSFSETAKNNTNSSLFADDIVFGEPDEDGYYNVMSPENIRYINNLEEFLAFRNEVNGGKSFAGMTVRLTADIDLGEDDEDWVGIGKDCDCPFEGIFDGQGHKIKNLYIYVRRGINSYYTGLFGVIGGNAVIKNFILETVEITLKGGGHSVGAVVGYANNVSGRIENVRVIVDGNDPFLEVDANHVSGVGAILGYDNDSPSLEILGCEVRGVEGEPAIVGGNEYVGGLIGYASNGIVIDGNIVADLSVNGTSSVGAIAGFMSEGGKAIRNTVRNVLVTSSNDNRSAVIAGTIEGKVTIADTKVDNVKVNGAEKGNVVSTAAKVGNDYYPTLKEAATDGEGKAIEVELFGEHKLADDMSYEHTNAVAVNGDLTYTRMLTAYWNPIYFPFEYEFDAENYDVAEFINVDGSTLTLTYKEDANVLEANKAYVIRPKTEAAKELTINLNGVTLEAATANIIDLYNGYSVKGNNIKYSGKEFREQFGENALVVGTKGNWGQLSTTSALKPFRLILTIPTEAQAVSMRFVRGTTAVEEVELDMQQAESIFDLSGRRVETMTEGGIYIVNGKKIIF